MSVSDLLKFSDLTAAATGAAFAVAYNTSSTPSMAAITALVTSVLSRLISDSLLADRFESLSTEGKNQIIVAALSGIYSYSKKGSPVKAMLTGVSVDLIGAEILKIFKKEDSSVFSDSKKEPEPVR
jgi:hypothetical protein